MHEATKNVPLSARERDLLLAAVRLWQAWQFPNEHVHPTRVSVPKVLGSSLLDIADNGRDAHMRLEMQHLDRLARRFGGA